MIVLFLKYPNKYYIFFGYFRTLTVYFQHNHDFKKTCFLLLLLFFSGTRYRRRGVDDDGDVANYVETEQVWGQYSES